MANSYEQENIKVATKNPRDTMLRKLLSKIENSTKLRKIIFENLYTVVECCIESQKADGGKNPESCNTVAIATLNTTEKGLVELQCQVTVFNRKTERLLTMHFQEHEH